MPLAEAGGVVEHQRITPLLDSWHAGEPLRKRRCCRAGTFLKIPHLGGQSTSAIQQAERPGLSEKYFHHPDDN